ncbi:hypothetical protein 04086_4616 [Escherichia phage 04086]|nr:hypothetical protein 04086_4616 [Escherichia phage 04086]
MQWVMNYVEFSVKTNSLISDLLRIFLIQNKPKTFLTV